MATSLLDLPIDILHSITPYLDATSFVNLCSTCKALHDPYFFHDSHYWSTFVKATFRVPNQPVVENDGRRWQQLCKRLLTQSRLYTWGNNEKACLGHSYDQSWPAGAPPPRRSQANARRRRHISWPAEMLETEDLGIVSDIQCGGWSTTMLTAKGALYSVGVLDGLQFNQRHPPYMQVPKTRPIPLRYPPGFSQQAERHDPATAIKQFSAGRAHVLGLSDSGKIWSWQNMDHAGLTIKFMDHETIENQSNSRRRGTVQKVVGGWNKSAALIEGTGIVLWEPVERSHHDTEIEDAALLMESAVVPKTNFRLPKSSSSHSSIPNGNSLADRSVAESIGEVQSFIVLEATLLFNTHLGKLFAAQIIWDHQEQRVSEPIELSVSSSAEESTDLDESFVTDVQGSFHNFAVFTRSGAVLTSTQDRVMPLLQRQNQSSDSQLFKRIPALQNKGVISLAFGDYHFHALHSKGYITSYGTEPQACGALGLGGDGSPMGRLRGMRYNGGDGWLVPHAYTEGRRIWFEDEKRDWLLFLTAGGVNPAEAAERMRMALGSPDVHCQGEVSEWVEQEAQDWESKFNASSDDDDGLGAYFALSVAAAGWHSGALVLVNEQLAAKLKSAVEIPDPEVESMPMPEHASEKTGGASNNADSQFPNPAGVFSSVLTTLFDYFLWFLGLGPYGVMSQTPNGRGVAHETGANGNANRVAVQIGGGFSRGQSTYGISPREGFKYIWANDHFPRLVLSNGDEMQGTVAFDEWRYGRPVWDLDAGP